jgi:hypothetical protein
MAVNGCKRLKMIFKSLKLPILITNRAGVSLTNSLSADLEIYVEDRGVFLCCHNLWVSNSIRVECNLNHDSASEMQVGTSAPEDDSQKDEKEAYGVR